MDGRWLQSGRINTLGRSVVVSLAVFVVELTGVAACDALGVASAIAFAAVQLVGTCLTFLANKYWTFDAAKTGRGPREVVRSAAVFAGSFALNIALPSAATYFMRLRPTIAFTVSQIVVGLGWNYPMNRWWVFDPSSAAAASARRTGSPAPTRSSPW
jgi:putative flippase GtrA